MTLGRHNSAGKPVRAPNPLTQMAFRDTWHRTLVYFGLADDEEYEEEEYESYPNPNPTPN